ncbi:membrane protein [Cytophagales bacterium WSM2-2]|nr:membrane protein [Cytophagales bacterium WSM2-2]
MNFQKANNIFGWAVFAVALLTYFLTMEETASYWDCGEFIAVSYKLQVPHPPGAPLFLLMGRAFSFLAFGDVTKVAYWINFMSVLASAFTILFLFWSITLFGRKMMGIKKDSDITENQLWTLMGAGLVGSLVYTFSDSFWFSAVEAEVYGMSSFFTAFVVWGVLKWDVIEDDSKANRWLLLVAYMIGLSIGVHMLNLVTLPALGLIFYFKKFKPTAWGVFATLALSAGLVLFINDFIVPGLPTLAGHFELFFVNTLGLFFGSGALVFTLLLVATLVYGIYFTHVKNHPVWNTFLLATAFILIGYGSYATVVIRSSYNTLIDENSPKDVMSFVRYLKREQYGSRPLAFGPYFTAQPIDVEYGEATYNKGKDKYEIGERKFEYVYEPGEKTLLPRAWNSEHAATYRNYMGLAQGQKPTFLQDKMYMFRHQIGRMYMRYFMWNFVGRESDEQGANWLRPNDWFKKLPASLAENRGRNNFFAIPFILGLIGMFYQFTKDTKNFAIVGLLFVMTGVAIVVYLNSPPVEPRERDYIYAGSYYAFAFWIGLAVIGIADFFGGFMKNKKVATVVATLLGLIAPVLMAQAGWDDHNRSDRFFSVDSASNYLESCDPQGVLYTGGDNDTFPLWYAQETEAIRSDTRVLVLSYYNTDWYIQQSARKAYTSEPLQYSLPLKEYQQGGLNDYLPFADLKIKSIDAKEYIGLLAKRYPQLNDGNRSIVPSRVLTIPIDKKAIIAKGIIPKGMDSLVVDEMKIKVLRGGLEKKDLALLDFLVTSNWDRPIYLNPTSISQINIDLSPYAVQVGNAYRILPVRNPRKDREYLVDTEKSLEVMTKKFKYRGLDNPKVYYNDDYKGFVLNHRSSMNTVAQALLDKGENEKAKELLMFSLSKMPDKAVPYDYTASETAGMLFKLGEKTKALEIAKTVGDRAIEMSNFLIAEGSGLSNDLRNNIVILNILQRTLYENGANELAKKYEDAYTKLLADLQLSEDGDRSDY